MPITSILTQPASGSINAAYRPIVFLVRATNTDGSNIPPVVYCDIYFNAVFYKTIAKTHFKVLNSGNSDWQFDIQDACQEVIAKRIGVNGGSELIKADDLYKSVYCKFRSSGYNGNGFITPEGATPIQGTGLTAPTAGTGTQSNSFFILNATLQHANNQDLAAHLIHYENGTWASNARPLTHRQNKYKIGTTNSDYFPFWYGGSNEITGISLTYRLRGASGTTTVTSGVSTGGGGGTDPGPGGSTCVPVSYAGDHILPDGTVGQAYLYSFDVAGDLPFVFSNIVRPGWMTITAVGNAVTFSGTPTTEATGISVSFDVTNCSSANTLSFTDTINIAAATVNISGTITNTPHSVTVNVASSVSCNMTFPILGMNDDNGTPVEFEADVTVFAGNTTGTESGIAPVGAILGILPTTSGTTTFIYSERCNGVNYVYTLEITNVY